MEWLMDMEELLSVAKVDLAPVRRISVLSLLSLKKLCENYDLSSSKQLGLNANMWLFSSTSVL